MPILDMSDFDTQSDAMSAIDMVLDDYDGGFINSTELIHMIKAINVEWKI